MAKQRMAGKYIFKMMQQKQQKDLQENIRIRTIMERQRQRDVAAAKGRIIPVTKADII